RVPGGRWPPPPAGARPSPRRPAGRRPPPARGRGPGAAAAAAAAPRPPRRDGRDRPAPPTGPGCRCARRRARPHSARGRRPGRRPRPRPSRTGGHWGGPAGTGGVDVGDPRIPRWSTLPVGAPLSRGVVGHPGAGRVTAHGPAPGDRLPEVLLVAQPLRPPRRRPETSSIWASSSPTRDIAITHVAGEGPGLSHDGTSGSGVPGPGSGRSGRGWPGTLGRGDFMIRLRLPAWPRSLVPLVVAGVGVA